MAACTRAAIPISGNPLMPAAGPENIRIILDAIGQVNVGLATLSANVMNLDKRLDHVSLKIDAIDREKAPRTRVAGRRTSLRKIIY